MSHRRSAQHIRNVQSEMGAPKPIITAFCNWVVSVHGNLGNVQFLAHFDSGIASR